MPITNLLVGETRKLRVGVKNPTGAAINYHFLVEVGSNGGLFNLDSGEFPVAAGATVIKGIDFTVPAVVTAGAKSPELLPILKLQASGVEVQSYAAIDDTVTVEKKVAVSWELAGITFPGGGPWGGENNTLVLAFKNPTPSSLQYYVNPAFGLSTGNVEPTEGIGWMGPFTVNPGATYTLSLTLAIPAVAIGVVGTLFCAVAVNSSSGPVADNGSAPIKQWTIQQRFGGEIVSFDWETGAAEGTTTPPAWTPKYPVGTVFSQPATNFGYTVATVPTIATGNYILATRDEYGNVWDSAMTESEIDGHLSSGTLRRS